MENSTLQETQKESTQELATKQGEEVKEQPSFYVIPEAGYLEVIAFLKKLPWETSDPVLQFLNKNAQKVRITQQSKDQENEEINKIPSNQ